MPQPPDAAYTITEIQPDGSRVVTRYGPQRVLTPELLRPWLALACRIMEREREEAFYLAANERAALLSGKSFCRGMGAYSR